MIKNRSIPQCTVIPELAYPDVLQAVDWLCTAYGFTLRIGMGSHRAQLNVGNGAVIIRELDCVSSPSTLGANHTVMVRVENVDSHHEVAARHGAIIVRPPTDYPYGERQYNAIDFAGHQWTFTQSIFDSTPEDWGCTLTLSEDEKNEIN